MLEPGVEYKHMNLCTLNVQYCSAWPKPGNPPTLHGCKFFLFATRFFVIFLFVILFPSRHCIISLFEFKYKLIHPEKAEYAN